MSRSTVPNEVLVAETKDVRPFARLLRGIGIKHQATMVISKAGFEISVEEVRTLCATAWIPTNLFDVYTYNPPPSQEDGETPSEEPSCFEISLDALLQCLNIFGNAGPTYSVTSSLRTKRRMAGDPETGTGDDVATEDTRTSAGSARSKARTGMRMSWRGPGHDLEVLLLVCLLAIFLGTSVSSISHDDSSRGPMTRCSLKVLEPEELMNQELDVDNLGLYLIMKSEWFRDALMDLPPTCTKITLTAFPAETTRPEGRVEATGSSNQRRSHRADVGGFSIVAKGDFGTAELDYPNDREVMDKFDCDTRLSFTYHAQHFAFLGRALQQAIKICLQIEYSGFVVIQIMMPVEEGVELGGHSGILEFKMNALEDDDLVE